MHGIRATLDQRRTSRKWRIDNTGTHVVDLPRLILTYLIPCRLITQHAIPSATLLAQAPGLSRLIGPLVSCIKRGDLTGFDKALANGEPEFVKRRIFLTLERSRDITLRNLLRKVYLAAGYDDLKEGQTDKDRIRKSRIPLINFATALRMGIAGEGSGQAVEDDEVECLLANQIYKVRLQISFRRMKCGRSCRQLLVHAMIQFGARRAPNLGPKLFTYSLATYYMPPHHTSLTGPTGSHEGLYITRTRHGGLEQEGRVSRNRGLMPNRICLNTAYDSSAPRPTRRPCRGEYNCTTQRFHGRD